MLIFAMLGRLAGAGLTLTLGVTPTVLPPDRLTDVTLEVHLGNRGAKPLAVYPDLAQWWVVGGWAGLQWELVASVDGKRQPAVELRTYYGPPASPPASSYFAAKRRPLQPGSFLVTKLRACFIPRRELGADALAPSTIDPQGMDGIGKLALPSDSAVLALGRDCATIAAQRIKARDYLRPGVIVIVPASGALDLKLIYRQSPWTSFHPEQSLSAESATTTLRPSPTP